MTDQVYMVLDYETFSECDIKKAGAYEYSMHSSTEILCVGYRVGTKKDLLNARTMLVLPGRDSDFYGHLVNPDVHLIAHNAFFEQCITANVGLIESFFPNLKKYTNRWVRPELSRWHCTAAMARSVGLPGSLEGAGLAPGLSAQKDAEGHRLMLKICKPRRPTKYDASTRHKDPDEMVRLYDYCKRDVDTEVELFLKLPPLHPKEREFWELDQKMNLRGFAVDRELVKGALTLIERETKRLDNTIAEITGGRLNSARQRDATLQYLREHALTSIPDLRSATVKETLTRRDLNPVAREILEIREAISRSSTAKYKAFEIRSRTDGRARDNTLFYGAHTGRQSGTGLQPQNLFKTILKQEDVDSAIPHLQAGDFDTIEDFFARPMDLYASAIRSCIISEPGKILDVGDFATIEVRVLFWLAGHKAGLDAFKRGEDLYLDMAAEIYDLDVTELTADYKAGDTTAKNQRQLGKQTVLGAGFGIGIGGEKFQATAKAYGMDISLALAQKAIHAYRNRHSAVPEFWNTIERAAKLAIQNPGKRYKHGFLIWQLEGDWLTCQLPIGRKLSYFKPRIEQVHSMYGARPTITYRGVESISRKFIRLSTWGGKLTENVVQAVARDMLMEALLRIENEYTVYPEFFLTPVLAVHDEIVVERDINNSWGHESFLRLMAKVPKWAKGLPIKVEGWCENRYRK